MLSFSFSIIGCEDVDGFEAIANGTKVDQKKLQRSLVAKAKSVVAQNPGVFRAFCFECTQMPPFSDAVRQATGIATRIHAKSITNGKSILPCQRANQNDKAGQSGDCYSSALADHAR